MVGNRPVAPLKGPLDHQGQHGDVGNGQWADDDVGDHGASTSREYTLSTHLPLDGFGVSVYFILTD